MELCKSEDIIYSEIAGDLVAKALGYQNSLELQTAYTNGTFSQKTQIVKCGAELSTASTKEQFSFLQSCKNLVIPTV